MTRQDIIDRLESLGVEHSVAYKAERARIEKERESLQELCGGLGHFFAKDKAGPLFSCDDSRVCIFCAKRET